MASEKMTTDDPPSPKPEFFRVLLPGSDFISKLSLPRSLTKYFMKENHKSATILSPVGKSWSIKVHGNANGLFFGDGWQDFAQTHDLVAGCILVFGYDGDMVFNVAIFDPSACEKEYFPMVQNNVTYSKIRTEEQTSKDDFNGGASKLSVHSQDSGKSEPTVCLWESSFKVTMRRSYLGPKFYMNIPHQASRYLWGTEEIVLRDAEKRLWPVKLYHRFSGARMRSSCSSGWPDFCINNCLEEGDVCIFELVSKEKKVMMHVNVQKHEHNLKNHSNRKRSIESRTRLTFSSTKPTVKKMKLVHSQDQKNIPHSSQMSNNLCDACQKTQQGRRQRCPVKVFHRCQKNKADTSFDPRASDKEYTPVVKNDMTCSALKIEEPDSAKDSKRLLAPLSKGTNKPPLHSSYCMGSEQFTCLVGQQFMVIIRASYIKCRGYMNIPCHVSQYLLDVKDIVLRDPKKRMWPMKLCHRHNGRYGMRTVVNNPGWRQFHVNNNLEEGDVCIFELVSKKKKVMMAVRIQKHAENNLKKDSNRERSVEARKYLKVSRRKSSITGPPVKKLKLGHSPDQKVSNLMGPSTPASFFKVTIKSGNLSPKKAYLNIPASFQALNDLSCVRQMILRDPERRRWRVNIVHKQKKTKKHASFGSGWHDFCTGNNLGEGDVCIFDHIENGNLMIVDIIKEQLVTAELQS